MNPRFLLTIGLLFGSSVAVLAHATEEDDAEAIRQTNNFYAEMLVAGDVDALMTLYDDSAILLSPNESPLHGKASIRASWEAFFADWDTLEARSVIDEIMVFGDWAYGHGHYRGRSQSLANGAVVFDALKFSGLWRRKPDGGWVIARDMFNVDAVTE